MARYGKEHKEQTRRRIVETSGRRFKVDGVNASGIATLMADAGLTNGAFYAHFASKDDLVAGVVAEQLGGQREAIAALPADSDIEQFVRGYLSVEHRDHPGDGCPSAALLDEIGRCDDVVRRAYTDGLLGVIDVIAARLEPDDPSSARVPHPRDVRGDGRDTAAGPRPDGSAPFRRAARARCRERAGEPCCRR